ncbi:tetratricopeptide (TPR) repeat protein [Sphingobium sp. OAS761]|uniref:NB-ARC domain-containing protein n=1 Tax=Sphingobium sp. OAS761 TaxID=2817901 RepID=UPI0020A06DEC|nr:NB-ARC domain-containing protein [Sphingobium sp. OAS761]MCP1468427.1 tetratricopeptide (TPR) repeat protein [Sphingobium sp. OAS761]
MTQMPLTSGAFVADVAAIYFDDGQTSAFGSGRLIAPGLILTAAHVVEAPSGAPRAAGWKVRIVGDRSSNGAWSGPPTDAVVVWRTPEGAVGPDIALLKLETATRQPLLSPYFCDYDLLAPLEAVPATGFPQARWDSGGTLKDYTIHGGLTLSEQGGSFDWAISAANKPDDRKLWKGMSGAVLAYPRVEGNALSVLGVVEEIPAHFSDGLLRVAPIGAAFRDERFSALVGAALGYAPKLHDSAFVRGAFSVDREREAPSFDAPVSFEPRVPGHYKDRVDELEQAYSKVTSLRWCGIYGVSGSGKSSTAARLAQRLRSERLQRVFWIPVGAGAEASVILEYIAATGGSTVRAISDPSAKAARLRGVTHELGAVFIFDDVQSADLLEMLLSAIGEGNAVVVTAQQEWGAISVRYGVHPIFLDGLPTDAAVEMLDEILASSDTAPDFGDLELLTRELGNHPLAIEIIAAELSYDWTGTLTEFIEAMGQASTDDQDPFERLRMSIIAGVERIGPKSLDGFGVFGLFTSASVDRRAVVRICDVALGTDSQRFLKELRRRGMVKTMPNDRLALHPFIVNVARYLLRRDLNRSDSRYFDLVTSYLNHYRQRLREDGGYEWNLARYHHLLGEESEVIAAIDVAFGLWVERDDDQFGAVCVEMTFLISWYLNWRGLWDARIRLCRQITDLAEQGRKARFFSARRGEVGNLYVDRGWMHLRRNELALAGECVAGGLAWLEGNGDIIFAKELSGQVSFLTGEYNEAERVFSQLVHSVRKHTRSWFVFSYRLFDVCMSQGREQDADAILDNLITNQDNPKLVRNEIFSDIRGRILFRKGMREVATRRTTEALQSFEEADRNFSESRIVTPERVSALIQMAGILLARGDRIASSTALEAAHDIAVAIGDAEMLIAIGNLSSGITEMGGIPTGTGKRYSV